MQRTPMTVKQAAEYSCYSKGVIYDLIRTRKIPSYKVNTGKRGRVIIAKEELDDFLFGHRRPADWEFQEAAERLVAAK